MLYGASYMYSYVTDIDGALSPCKAVIKRHQSLVSTRDDILDNISTATAEVLLPYIAIAIELMFIYMSVLHSYS